MKKLRKHLTMFTLIFTISAASIPAVQPVEVQAKTTYVYITRTGKKYHMSKKCRTLKRSKKITKISLKKAKKKGYTKCKVCR